MAPSWQDFFSFGRAEHVKHVCLRFPGLEKNVNMHPRTLVKYEVGWETSVFARFGYVLGVKNVAKPSENAVFPAGTS